MTEEEAYRSFRMGESKVESDVKAGLLSREQARRIIEKARENYRKRNFDRENENALRNTKV